MVNPEKSQWKRLFAEGAAIVVSILLAFWIDAWWEDRELNQQLIGNLQALEQEMVLNQHKISRGIEVSSVSLEKMDHVLQYSPTSNQRQLPNNK